MCSVKGKETNKHEIYYLRATQNTTRDKNYVPRHSLDKSWSKTVEGHSDLHVPILREGVTVPKEHYLVVVPQEVVGERHSGGPLRDIDEAIRAGLERAVVDPHVAGPRGR